MTAKCEVKGQQTCGEFNKQALKLLLNVNLHPQWRPKKKFSLAVYIQSWGALKHQINAHRRFRGG